MFRLVAVLSRTVFALGALSLSIGIARASTFPAISNPTPVPFGSQPVGSAQAQTTVTFTVTTGGTLSATPLVLTTGQPNLDFTLGMGSTCTGSVSVSVGYCTVNVIFTPRAPGQRLGAVVLQAGGSTVATALLYGTGTGPAVVFPGNTSINTLGPNGTFISPWGVALDGAGNVYVADEGTNLVKEIVAAGGYTTINTLGSGFSKPYSVAVDGAGNVYVADSGHNAVKEIMAVGGNIPASNPTINTLGSGFSGPYGVAVDGAGNVYVADTSHSAVKEIVAVNGSIPASNPTINTLGPTGSFLNPVAVAVDGAGNVYVADTGNNVVKEIVAVNGSIPASNPTINTLGSGFSGPYGVAVDGAGNVYVADTTHSLMKEIVAVGGSIPTSNPTITRLGTGFGYPTGVAVDGAGNVYVADYGNSFVKEIPLATPPSLAFASTSVGNTSSDSPKTLTLQNIGNTSIGNTGLTFPIPTSGTNPALSSNYTLSSGGSTACPQLTTSSSAQTLAPGTCTAVVSFTPVKASTAAGTLVFTDNSNNVTNATQTVTLTGTATAATGTTAQTITFPQPTTPAQPGTTAPLTASSTSGLAIVYSVVSGPATLSGSNVTYAGGGTVVLEADQYGNNTYSAATAVQRTVTVQAGVGTAGPTQTATVTITTAGTLNTISVLTTGKPNLDFTFASGGTCTVGTAYTVGQTCTVNYTFTPMYPSQRRGAVVLADSSGNVLANTYISGLGTGPQVAFPPVNTSAVTTTLASGAGNVQGVAVDGFGDVFYTPNASSIVELVAVNGVLTASPATRTFTASNTPTGLAFDGAGNLYCSGFSGNVTEYVAVGGSLPASPAVRTFTNGFVNPESVAVDSNGNVYVGDNGNNKVLELSPVNGVIPTTATPTSLGSFTSVFRAAVDAAGDVFVANGTSNVVTELLAVGGQVPASPTSTIVGSGFNHPIGVSVDALGNVYVSDGNNHAFKEVVAVNGVVSSSSTVLTLGSGFSQPTASAVDANGNLYVADNTTQTVREFNVVTPTPLAFANTAVGGTSAAQTVNLENIGNASLSLASVTASTTNFTGSLGTCTATLASDVTCAPSFAFTPQSATALTGNGIVTDNSLNLSGSTQTVALSGTGTIGTKTITFPQPTTPVVAGTSATLTASTSNGDPVVFTITAGTATISGTTTTNGTTTATIVYTNSGSVTIAANSAATANYAAAATVSDSVTVTAAPASYAAPNTAVGTTSATQTAEVTFTTAGTLGTISNSNVLTLGSPSLDYKYVAGGSCTAGIAYSVGQSCSVLYTFTPAVPGVRDGAITLTSSTNVVLATSYLSGTGNGPLAVAYPGVLSNVVSGLTDAFGIAIDATGNLYVVNNLNGQLYKETYNGSSYVTSTLAGFGGGGYQVAVDGSGNLYVTTTSGLYKLTLNPATGAYVQSTISSALTSLSGVAVDASGNLFIAYGATLYKETPNGSGGYTQSTVASGLSNAFSLAVDGAGNLFVNDYGANGTLYLYKYAAGTYTRTTITTGLSNNNGVAVDASGIVYVVASSTTSGVLRYVPSGSTYTALPAVDTGTIPRANGIAVDGRGNLFITSDNSAPIGVFKVDVDTATPATLTYPSTAVGATSAGQSVTVFDIGNTSLTFASFAPSTANFADSAGTTTCSTSTALLSAGSCTVGFAFTPQATGSQTGNGIVTDNSLNVSGSTQTVALSGTGTIGTKTITFPQPTTPVVAGTSATLTASTSNGDPVVFTITAGTATISGTTTTNGTTTATIVYTNSGSVTIAANSAATANYAAAATVSDSVTVTPAPASSTAPTTAVGTTSATQTAEVTFATAGTPSTIGVVTQGATGLDFAFVSGGTCSTSTAYTIGQSCTVQYTFTPSATGPRYGAVVLSFGATVLGTSYLGGVGTGPVAGFTQSSFSGAADGVGGNVQYPALVLGGTSPNPTGNGNVLYIPNNSNVLSTYTIGAGLTTFYGGAGTARYRGAAVDGAGNVYVSDVTSNNVFKLSSSGTLLATWPVSGVSLSSPWGMVFGTDGTLYVANPGANDIVAITPAGVASVVTVSGYSFTAYSLGIDGSNNLYIPDNVNSRILKVPGNSGAGGAAAFVSVTGTAISAPGGVAIDSAGELYVTEGNSTVLRISAAGVSAAVPETGLSSPAGVVTDNRGHVYVTDAAVASLFTLTLASPPALSFGSVSVGSSSTQAVTLLNSGNASLSLASVTASNANFTGALGTCGATLASGISCAPRFTFTPQSATTLTGTGVVTDNSLNVSGSTQTVALSGTGTPAPTITSYTPNPVPTGGNITVTATGTSLSGTTGVCIFQTGYMIDCDSASNVTATSFTFVTSPSVGAGTYCLRVGSSTGNPCITYTVSSTPSTFGSLAVTGYASPAVITEGGTVTVTAYYTNGSVDTLFTGTVTLTSSDSKATLPAAYTFQSSDNGVHTFNVTLNTLGTQSITATSGSVSGSQTGIPVGDAIWVLDGTGSLVKVNAGGGVVGSGAGANGTASSFGGVAFDSAGDVFSVSAGANALAFATYAGGSATTYTGGGLNAPVSVAVDGAGYIWIANSGNNTVSEFTNGRAAMSPSAGYGTSAGLNAPSSVSIDPTGGVWIANGNGNSVTHIFGAATPVVTPLAAGTLPQ